MPSTEEDIADMIVLTSSTEENDSRVTTMVVQSNYDRRTRLGGGSMLTTGAVRGGSVKETAKLLFLL